jgi:hypothetical protein
LRLLYILDARFQQVFWDQTSTVALVKADCSLECDGQTEAPRCSYNVWRFDFVALHFHTFLLTRNRVC